MPRPANTRPKSYGRQAGDQTIKSLSLDDLVVKHVQAEAQRRGLSFSRLVNDILKGEIIIAPPAKKSKSAKPPRTGPG